MTVKKIVSAADVAGLEFGDQFIIDVGFDEADHDPIEYADAYLEAVGPINAAIESRFVPDVGKPAEPTITVEWSDTYAIITSPTDQTVEVGGDVRDGTAKLKAGKPSKRKLQKVRDGYITINGEEYRP